MRAAAISGGLTQRALKFRGMATVGGGCAAADGPLPIGDVIGAPLVIAAAIWWATDVVTDWWDNAKTCDECDTQGICRRLLTLCLENLWQPPKNRPLYGPRKDCGACYRECVACLAPQLGETGIG